MKIHCLFVVLIATQLVAAQQSKYFSSSDKELREAEELLFLKSYKASEDKFEKVLLSDYTSETDKESASFYSSKLSIVNKFEGAEDRMAQFVKAYPRSIYAEGASQGDFANAYYELGDYESAKKAYEKLDVSKFKGKEKGRYYFSLGYTDFLAGKYDLAKENIRASLSLGAKKVESNYLLGHIAYLGDDYDSAIKHFDVIAEDPVYAKRALPYLAQISYKNERYEDAILYGKQFVNSDSDNDKLVAEVSKIVGESYFSLKKYGEAGPYLAAYLKNTKTTPRDRFQYALSLFKGGDIKEAIKQYERVVKEGDPALAQKSYYQLGNIWLKEGNTSKAKKDYRYSVKFAEDKELEEDALYKIAKIDFKNAGTDVSSKVVAIKGFMDKYPYSIHKIEFDTYLSDAYLSNGDYKKALAVLSSSDISGGAKLEEIKQKIAYKEGVKAYKSGDYEVALIALDESILYKIDPKIHSDALYLKSDALYKLGRLDEQLVLLSELEGSSSLSDSQIASLSYQKAYTYYNKKEYANAAIAFEQFLIGEVTADEKGGAMMRLGDSYTNLGKYQKAADVYNVIINEGLVSELDQVSYQRAKVFQGLGDVESETAEYERFLSRFPNSKLADEVNYQVGDLYFKADDREKALVTFEKVITKSDNKEYIAKSMLKKGLLLTSLKRATEALSVYQEVIIQYPETNYAFRAIGSARDVFVDKGDVKGLKKWLSVAGVDLADQDFEGMSYDSAEKMYLEKNYAAAIEGLEDFLREYPSTGKKTKIHYMLGNSYFALKDNNGAAENYRKVALGGGGDFRKKSLDRLTTIYIALDDYPSLAVTFEELYKIEKAVKKTEIEVKLMKIYQRNEEWGNAVKYARLVERHAAKNDPVLLQEVRMLQVRSLAKLGSIDQTKAVYKKLASSSDESIRAEATFYELYFLNKEGKYEGSIDKVFDMLEKYPNQQYWGAKSFVVLADNFNKTGDKEQAILSLETVIENYGSDFEDVNQEAKALLKQIKN